MSSSESKQKPYDELCITFSCELSIADLEPVLILVLPKATFEYSVTCAICLYKLVDKDYTNSLVTLVHQNTLFHPYALGCGHIFCKSRACSASSAGVHGNTVRVTELDLLIKQSFHYEHWSVCRFKEQWKERLVEEQAEVAKQVKEHPELQSMPFTGIHGILFYNLTVGLVLLYFDKRLGAQFRIWRTIWESPKRKKEVDKLTEKARRKRFDVVSHEPKLLRNTRSPKLLLGCIFWLLILALSVANRELFTHEDQKEALLRFVAATKPSSRCL
ncbi:E3 ubiquitin-protein ligase BAH1-like 1 [Artemisia annua]|uniref:E3 ubiquitin-protein ligase BAH1-like 1 n=1 Tax=Artemisia annua TaxID=35608 RepID=A0A2U1KUM1_ARTAN|nr:E3 ubiquitin-protein ligase BAH1-like 1 [Artemisia annua]